MYTSSHICKQEKSKNSSRTLYKLSKNASNLTVKQQSRKVMMGILNSREVSMQESLWIRSDRPLCKSSRKVITVPALHLHIKNSGESDDRGVQDVFIRPDGSALVTNKNVRFYEDRPISCEKLSLFEWLPEYTSTTRKNDVDQSLRMVGRVETETHRYATKRHKKCVVASRYRLNPTEAATFSKGILFLHAPWRRLDRILLEGSTACEYLQSILSSTDMDRTCHARAMIDHYKDLHATSSALDAQKSLDAAQAAENQESEFGQENSDSDDGSTWGDTLDEQEEDQDLASGESATGLPEFEQRNMIGR